MDIRGRFAQDARRLVVMRRLVLLVLVVACRSPEKEAAPIVVAPASVAPVADVMPSATSVASTTIDNGGPIVIVDAARKEKDDDARARERARLAREPSAQQLQILAMLGSRSDAGSESPLTRGDLEPIDLSSVAMSPRDAGGGGAGLDVGRGGGGVIRGGLSDLGTLRDH